MSTDESQFVDHYAVLGLQAINVKATTTEIRKAYQKLALLHHPDKVAESKREEAHLKFVKIGAAYEVLSSEETRRDYDTRYKEHLNNLSRKAHETSSQQHQHHHHHEQQQQQRPPNADQWWVPQDVDLDDLGDLDDPDSSDGSAAGVNEAYQFPEMPSDQAEYRVYDSTPSSTSQPSGPQLRHWEEEAWEHVENEMRREQQARQAANTVCGKSLGDAQRDVAALASACPPLAQRLDILVGEVRRGVFKWRSGDTEGLDPAAVRPLALASLERGQGGARAAVTHVFFEAESLRSLLGTPRGSRPLSKAWTGRDEACVALVARIVRAARQLDDMKGVLERAEGLAREMWKGGDERRPKSSLVRQFVRELDDWSRATAW